MNTKLPVSNNLNYKLSIDEAVKEFMVTTKDNELIGAFDSVFQFY